MSLHWHTQLNAYFEKFGSQIDLIGTLCWRNSTFEVTLMYIVYIMIYVCWFRDLIFMNRRPLHEPVDVFSSMYLSSSAELIHITLLTKTAYVPYISVTSIEYLHFKFLYHSLTIMPLQIQPIFSKLESLLVTFWIIPQKLLRHWEDHRLQDKS